MVVGVAQPQPGIQIHLSLLDLNVYRPSHGFKVHPQGAQGLIEQPTNFLQHW